jgi:hypothetical protein
MILTLKRVSTPSSVRPTFGVLLREDGVPFAVTLERQWRNNAKGESCIPVATYANCVRVDSPKFGDTFEVTGVPGRDKILFHKGNIDDDSHGCILVGEQFDPVKGEDGILASQDGFAEFLTLLKGIDTFTLIVQQT